MTAWLGEALSLFSATLDAVAGEPVLRFFLSLVPALCAGNFVMNLIRQGRKGKL